MRDRAQDVLEPLFAIAELAGASWPSRVREAAIALMNTSRSSEETERSIALSLLREVRSIFHAEGNPEALPTNTDKSFVPPRTGLLDALIAIETSPWGTFSRGGRPITAHRLARLLREFGVVPGGKMRDGSVTFRGYRLAAFDDAFARYLPAEAEQWNSANGDGHLSSGQSSGQRRRYSPSECSNSSLLTDVSSPVPLSEGGETVAQASQDDEYRA